MNEIVGCPVYSMVCCYFAKGRTREKACRSFLLRYLSCKDIFGDVRGRANVLKAALDMSLKVNLAWNEICLKKRSLIREEVLVLSNESADCRKKIDLFLPIVLPLEGIFAACS